MIEKPLFLGPDHRVKNALEPLQCRGIGKDALAEERPIDPARFGANTGECRQHRLNGGAARREQSVNDAIGVEQRNSEPPQHRRSSAFAHADRAGQAEDDQRDGVSVATIAARS